MATYKSKGLTESERYLANLCEKSFLSLWSYPNVFRDQGRKEGKGDGKELCDLLVVFDRDVIIFSDKSCAVQRHWRHQSRLGSVVQSSDKEVRRSDFRRRTLDPREPR